MSISTYTWNLKLYILLLSYICHLSITTLSPPTNGFTIRKFRRLKNYRLYPRKKGVSADSPVSCCRLCVRDDTCFSVNYKDKSLLCELVVGTSLPYGNLVPTDNWDLYTSDDTMVEPSTITSSSTTTSSMTSSTSMTTRQSPTSTPTTTISTTTATTPTTIATTTPSPTTTSLATTLMTTTTATTTTTTPTPSPTPSPSTSTSTTTTTTTTATTTTAQQEEVWLLAFRGMAGIGVSIYDAWTTGTGTTESPMCVDQTTGQCSDHYRNYTIWNQWNALGISKVNVSLYQNDAVKAYVTFYAGGSNNMDWFDKNRVSNTSWTDLTEQVINYFSIEGISPSRRFYISPPHYGCEVEYGYIAVITEYAYSCSWDNWPEFSTILFSPTNSHEVWSGPIIAHADYLTISVQLYDDTTLE